LPGNLARGFQSVRHLLRILRNPYGERKSGEGLIEEHKRLAGNPKVISMMMIEVAVEFRSLRKVRLDSIEGLVEGLP
jgi:hypothetical protein